MTSQFKNSTKTKSVQHILWLFQKKFWLIFVQEPPIRLLLIGDSNVGIISDKIKEILKDQTCACDFFSEMESGSTFDRYISTVNA